jgi:hypothetical protein
MHVVGISGPIESGKTTFADLLVGTDPDHTAHLETSTVVMELCNEFNAALALQPVPFDAVQSTNRLLPSLLPTLSAYSGKQLGIADINVNQADIQNNPIWYDKLFKYYDDIAAQPELIGQTITAQNKPSYRALMQWLGGYFLYRLADPVMWYRELSKRIASFDRSVDFVALTALRQPAEADYIHSDLTGLIIMMQRPNISADANEVTEKRIAQIKPDITVINNGSVADLKKIAAVVLSDIKTHTYKSSYSAV